MPSAVNVLAAGLAQQLDKIGPYVGFISLLAVAAMAFLVLSQGREIQRLRDWAGSDPERAGDPEAAGPSGSLGPPPGAQTLPPVQNPQPPVPGQPPVVPAQEGLGQPATAVAPQPLVPQPGVPVAPGTPATPRPTPPTPAGVAPLGSAPAPVTPVGTARARAAQGLDKRKASVPTLIGAGLLTVVVIAAIALLLSGAFGDGQSDGVKSANDKLGAIAKPSNKVSKSDTSVVVLNGSGIQKLAATVANDLSDSRWGVDTTKTSTLTLNGAPVTNQQQSGVYYNKKADNGREAAAAIAAELELKKSAVHPLSTAIKNAVQGTPDIVVVLGQNLPGAKPSGTSTTGTSSTPTGTGTGTSTSTGTGTGTGATDSTGAATGTPPTGVTEDTTVTP